MVAHAPRSPFQLAASMAAIIFWAVSLWRIARWDRGNKVIECGLIAIAIVLAMAFLSRVTDIPDWALASLIALLVVLCFATLFFFAQECYRALRRSRK